MAMATTSCGQGPEIVTQFDFEVEVLPYRTELSPGDTAEIGLTIVADGEWSGESYSLRYFRSEGSGWMADGGSNRIVENHSYMLPSRTVELEYHTLNEGSERFTIWISDSSGVERECEFEMEVR